MIIVDIPLDVHMYSIEGIDGSGKTTQSKLIEKKLIEKGYDVKSVHTPSKTLLGDFLRENLMKLNAWEKSTLFLLDMIQVIKTNSLKSRILLWDRYTDSSLVSNWDINPDEASEWIKSLPLPRKTFLLDIEPEIVLRKRPEKAGFDTLDLKWQYLKYNRYKELIRKNPKRFVEIKADRKIETITDEIVNIIIKDIKDSEPNNK